jgi:hypothetical protein
MLVVTQMALGLMLVVGAGLVVQSFTALAASHPGFDPSNTLTLRVSVPPGPSFASRAAAQAYHDELRERLASLPGVAAAGAISQLPLTGQGPLQPYAYDAETARNWEQLSADGFNVTTGYFASVRATMLAGRDFTQDEIANGRRVIVIDDSLAERAFGGAGNAVGRRLQLEPEPEPKASSKSSASSRTCGTTTCAARSCHRSIAEACSGPSAWRFELMRTLARSPIPCAGRSQTCVQAPPSRTFASLAALSTTRSVRCGSPCG